MKKDDKDIILELKGRMKYVESAYSQFVIEGERDIEMYRGEHFTEEQRKKLKEEGRPIVEFNHIKPKINTLKGQQSQNRYYFKVVTADNVSDQEPFQYDGQPISADQLSLKLSEELKTVEEECDGEYELSDCFSDGIVTARSYFEAFIKVDKSVFPYKHQVVFENRAFNEVFPDPDSKKYDFSDSRYFFKFREIAREDLEQLFPEKKKEIKELKRANDFLEAVRKNKDNELSYKEDGNTETEGDDTDKDTDLILVEYFYYYYKESSVFIVDTVNDMGMPTKERVDTEDGNRQEIIDALEVRKTINPNLTYEEFKLEKKQWVLGSYCDEKLLGTQDVKELDEAPFIQYCPDSIKSAREMWYKYISAVRDLRSPQMFINKFKGQAMAHLNSSVHSGIVSEQGVLIDTKKWDKFGSAPGFRGEIKKGAWGKWQQLHPAPLSQGHEYTAKDAAEEMKIISNIRDEFAGSGDKDQSGKAIALLQNAAFKGVHFYFDNFRRSKHLLAKKLIKLICYLKDIDHTKLKVVIDDAAESPTARYANWQETKELLETGAFESPFGDLIIRGMNINNREEWEERYNQVNKFKQWEQQQQMKAEAEKLAIEDSRKEGLIPKGAG